LDQSNSTNSLRTKTESGRDLYGARRKINETNEGGG